MYEYSNIGNPSYGGNWVRLFKPPRPKSILWSHRETVLHQPASVIAHSYHDDGLMLVIINNKPYGNGRCFVLLDWYNCYDSVIDSTTVGANIYHIEMEEAEFRYRSAKADIKEHVPAFNTRIDLRTLEQLRYNCCPPSIINQIKE
jgi:hypothetical protein